MFSNMFATVRFTMLPLVFYFYCRISTMGSLQTKSGKQKPNYFDCGKSYLQQIFGFRFGQ